MGGTTKLDLKNLFLTYGAIVSPLGNDWDEHCAAFENNVSAITMQKGVGFNQEDFPQARIASLAKKERFHHLLKLACAQLKHSLTSDFFNSKETLVILSSTKAELDLLPENPFSQVSSILTESLALKNQPIIISNACVSGVLALEKAEDYLSLEKYKQVLVLGLDVLSDFVTFGFQSLYALSDNQCQPYDAHRKGINLGEAFGAVILSKALISENLPHVYYQGSVSSNDANHISGPSRNGEGLYRAIHKLYEKLGIDGNQIDVVNAHGTATLYNDDMESFALTRANLQNVPMNSFKGYFGHTLGAAGIIETIVLMMQMHKQMIYKCQGTVTKGTVNPINVAMVNSPLKIENALKTASGFGGGNAVLLLSTNKW